MASGKHSVGTCSKNENVKSSDLKRKLKDERTASAHIDYHKDSNEHKIREILYMNEQQSWFDFPWQNPHLELAIGPAI